MPQSPIANDEPIKGRRRRRVRLPVAVLVLGGVSFFTDVSSEMIVPLLPLYLTTALGASALFVGLVDGLADMIGAWVKIFSGRWADRVPRKKPLTVAGYGISTAMRALMGFTGAPWQVLALRSADRVGKGLRTSPRDALIAEAVPVTQHGYAFGLHRAMDHAGALVGALVAALLLGRAGWSLQGIFLLAIVPGVIAMGVLVFGLRESPRTEGAGIVQGVRAESGIGGWQQLDGHLKQFLGLLALFALANSSDAFLLLKAQDVGIGAAWLPVLWMLLHFSKSLSVLPGGIFSDRFGRKGLLCVGWSLYAALYLLFGMAESQWQIWGLFGAYGLYYGLTEGVEKAFIADLARAGRTGTAFGWYHGVLGFAVLPAAVLMGWVWDHFGSRNAFFVSAGLSLVASAALSIWIRKQNGIPT